MDRNDFFKACQNHARGKKTAVSFDGIEYYPIAYQLAYNADGTVRHTAVLQDVKSKALVYCRLQDGEGKIEKLVEIVLTNNIVCGIVRPWNSAEGL